MEKTTLPRSPSEGFQHTNDQAPSGHLDNPLEQTMRAAQDDQSPLSPPKNDENREPTASLVTKNPIDETRAGRAATEPSLGGNYREVPRPVSYPSPKLTALFKFHSMLP
jgi:hypothetical protein